MLDGLKAYPKYMDIGQPWVGAVPAHWRSERGKRLFSRMQRPARDEDQTITCFRDGVVTLRKNRRLRGFTEALKEIGYQGVRVGDLVIHAMDAFAGAVGVSDSDGKCSPVYQVCQPRGDANAKYYAILVREMSRSQWIMALAKGIRERSTDFRFETFGAQFLPVPPPAEQAGIVRFLEAGGWRVNRFIRAKRRLLEVLTEQKQAIITHAVTRGIIPSAPLSPSGSGWFPELPARWSAATLRRVITRAVDGPHHSPTYVDNGVMFISARNVKVDEWSLADAKYISQADYEEYSRRIKPVVGDVLYTKGGTTGVARAVDLDFPFQVWVHIAVLKLRRTVITPAYLALALNSTPCYQQSQLHTRGATNQDLGLGRMKDIELPLPPSITDQDAIVTYVKHATSTILRAIADARREIDLIREYHTRLVADVVTGKIDVRAHPWAAAALTEDPVESDPAPDVDEADALEETADVAD